jgi:hypothetical protein
VSDDSEREYARMAEEARRDAEEMAGRATAEVERMQKEALSGEAGEESVRQQGVIYGGLVGVAVLMIQPFLSATSLDVSAKISVIAFAVAIPLLAALVMVNRQEVFRRRRTTSVTAVIAQVVAQMAAVVGMPPRSGTSTGSPASASWPRRWWGWACTRRAGTGWS